MRRFGRVVAIGAGVAAGAYLGLAASAWHRFGRRSTAREDGADVLLHRFIPVFDIVERHAIQVDAPAHVTFAAACAMDLESSRIVRTILRTRELVLGSRVVRARPAGSFIDRMRSMGWGVLAETPGQQIVMGAVTQPWEADVVFHPLPPDVFRTFAEPGFVKIAWTLKAETAGPGMSVFSTETRALATDESARRRFRNYWAFVSPGIVLIRWMMLKPVRDEAERRAARVRGHR